MMATKNSGLGEKDEMQCPHHIFIYCRQIANILYLITSHHNQKKILFA